MFFEKQKHTLSVDNVVDLTDPIESKHGPLLPNTIRCIICGPSNCGKTNVMFKLLTEENGLRFEHLYVYTKTPDQHKYKLLGEIMDNVVKLSMFTSSEDVPPPEKLEANSVFVFDDVICEKQIHMTSYFCRGRHNGVDSFYLTQTYSRIPKQLIRDNTNMIILYKQDETNLKHVYEDHCSSDMSFNEFKAMCSQCWNKGRYSFITIVKDDDLNNGRYRCGLDIFIKMTRV